MRTYREGYSKAWGEVRVRVIARVGVRTYREGHSKGWGEVRVRVIARVGVRLGLGL